MFNKNHFARFTAIGLAIISLSILSACSSEPEPEETVETAVEAAPRQAPAQRPRSTSRAVQPEPTMNSSSRNKFRYVPEVEGQLDSDGPGLLMVIDGSSTEAFKDSLAVVAADSSSEQYRQLERAIRFLNDYDPRFMGDDSLMRAGLDGMTGEEIIEFADAFNRQRMGEKYNPQ